MTRELSELRIGVIGTGEWGINHVRIFSELGVLHCVCDTDKSKTESISKRYKVKGYSDLDEMLDTEKLDAVTVCTPTITHLELASKTLKRGLSTLVEKPMTATSLDGRRLVELSKSSGALMAVGFVERFNPAVIEAKQVIKNRELGEPLLLEFHRESNWAGRLTDVGIIADISVHDIDTARWLFDEEPTSIFARVGRVISGRREDFAIITLRFSGMKSAFIMSNWVTPKRQRQLTIVCTRGVITIDFVGQEIRFDDANGTRIPRHTYVEPLRSELEDFLDAIRESRKPLVQPLDGLNNTILAEAALLSSEIGAPITLEHGKGLETGSGHWRLPLGQDEIKTTSD